MAAGEEQTITGTENDDVIDVKANTDDTIFGLGGNDVINAGAGFDTIDGGDGNDNLTGGAHDDTFVFTGPNFGNDVITDFKTGDVVDLSNTDIRDFDGTTGTVTTNANGDAVITDLVNGNTITLEKVSAQDFLADPGNFILATGPEFVQLGIDDTYVDAGDFTDQIIDGDNQGEEDTDTDTFIFGPGTGQDTITDFREEDAFIDPNGFPQTIPGDILDLSGYGIFGEDLTDDGFPAYFDSLVAQGLLSDWSVTSSETVWNFTDGSSLTMLGIGINEVGTVIELNMVRDTGGA